MAKGDFEACRLTRARVNLNRITYTYRTYEASGLILRSHTDCTVAGGTSLGRLLAGSSEQLGQLGAVEAVERSSCYLVDLQRNCCSRLQVFQNLPIVHYRCWFGAMLTVWYLLMTLWYLLVTLWYLLMTVRYLLMTV